MNQRKKTKNRGIISRKKVTKMFDSIKKLFLKRSRYVRKKKEAKTNLRQAKKRTQKDAKTVAFEFLTGAGKNSHGKHLIDIQGYTEWELEHDHSYIQWIFPLDTPSDHNFLAPVITSADIDRLDSENLSLIQGEMIHSLSVMLHFYGFRFLKPGEGKLIGKHEYKFSKNKQNWCVMYNHNHLRITRILKSLRLFGLEQYAVAFYQALISAEEEEKREHANELGWLVNPTTLRFWAEAVGE